MKKLLLFLFIAVFDPLTRLGSPTNRANPLLILIICGVIGTAGYFYYTSRPSSEKQFMQAAEQGDLEKVQGAIDAGVPVGHRDEFGRTAVHLAARYDNAKAVKLLLEQGANPNAQDKKGQTPLHLTRYDQADNIETVRVLLEGGADPNIKDNKGITALQAARNEVRYTKQKQDLLKEFGAQ